MKWLTKPLREKIQQLARKEGTPFYLYHAPTIVSRCRALKRYFTPLKPVWYYAVKANPRLAILRLIRQQGFGAEVVSAGEIYIAEKAGYSPASILFNGNGKTPQEVEYALQQGVRQFNFDALDQWELLEKMGKKYETRVRAFLRLNPGIRIEHPHLAVGDAESKFGLSFEEAVAEIPRLKRARYAPIGGVHCHVGSQILSEEPFLEGARKASRLFRHLKRKGLPVEDLNLGGGFGVPYHPSEKPFPFPGLMKGLKRILNGLPAQISYEPGRFLVAEAGILVCRVISIKQNERKTIVVVDGGLTENIRPALYGAYHPVFSAGEPLVPHPPSSIPRPTDVVGPVCESSDFFALNIPFPEVKTGDWIAVGNCGAYCASMQSNYNSRLFPAEYLIQGGKVRLIRHRQPLPSLLFLEPP